MSVLFASVRAFCALRMVVPVIRSTSGWWQLHSGRFVGDNLMSEQKLRDFTAVTARVQEPEFNLAGFYTNS